MKENLSQTGFAPTFLKKASGGAPPKDLGKKEKDDALAVVEVNELKMANIYKDSLLVLLLLLSRMLPWSWLPLTSLLSLLL